MLFDCLDKGTETITFHIDIFSAASNVHFCTIYAYTILLDQLQIRIRTRLFQYVVLLHAIAHICMSVHMPIV